MPQVQLPLHIGLRDSATFANFYPGPNRITVEALQGDQEPFIYLWGSPGSGKSHLLQAACHHLRGAGVAYLPFDGPDPLSPEMLEGLEQMGLVALDGLEAIAADPLWETALFHLYNRIRDNGGRLYMAGESAPQGLGIGLPDLASRLGWGLVLQLQSLSDEEKGAALALRARMRGLELAEEVTGYLLRHHARDLTTLFALLDELDHASLVAQRRLTIPFVRAVLDRRGG